MKVLVGCEFSQVVTKAFRDRGHEAFSCDLLPTEGDIEWHLQMDVFEAIEKVKPELGIFHPPCTYLTLAGNRWFKPEYKERYPNRGQQRQEAIEFIKQLFSANIQRIAIENPLGILSTSWKQPTQIIQPYYFGDPQRKTTCLWLKNLPKLKPTKMVKPEIIHYKNGKGTDSAWHINTFNLPKAIRSKERGRTFPGIAEAMAEQWGNYREIQSELLLFNMSEVEGKKP
jgi:site-specific DNA-cytosine methylase